MFAAALPTRLHPFDLALIVVYLIGITVFGLRFRNKGDKSLSSYFLAGRSIPWWAIALSIVSAETSTLTIISVPGIAYTGDFTFLQLVLGYMVGRIVICVLFLPKYFQGELFTAYQLIDRRFGPALHKVTAALFLLTRAAAEGVRVFAVSIVVGLAIGTNDVVSIAIISLLTLLYTFEGGMAAVIWTDVVQMFLYIAGTLVAIVTLGQHVSGGWSAIHAMTGAAGKLSIFNFALNVTQTYTFWAGLLGGTFLTMASHGTDQLMVQRLLAGKNLRESRLALLFSGAVVFLQFSLFLIIGAGLFVFYKQQPGALTATSSDRIFPAFIVQQMPIGIAGLLIAAILAAAMSNLSAALNSLSSTTIVDFYLHVKPDATDRERNILSKASTILWALVLFALAVYSVHAGGKGHVVETGLTIASVAYGSLLGVFLLGTLTRYATQWGAIAGMITGFAFNLFLWLQPHAIHLGAFTLPKIAYTWYVFLGAIVTFLTGSAASFLLPKGKSRTIVAATVLGTLLALSPCPQRASAQANVAHAADFAPIDVIMADALAAKQLPGGVVVIGHNGQVVFKKAYGNRVEDPSVEPATIDTIYDMASLSKCLSTATSIMQLYEAGKLNFDDPVVKYLPEFAANGKSNITLRQLLTHYSGLSEDVNLKDAWGLAKPDKAEGIRRAMAAVPYGPAGVTFKYSDINYITLGAIVEKLSGETLDAYAEEHIFRPLRMKHTRYNPPASWAAEIAPATHDNEGSAATNPDYDHMIRGVVHDPTTRRMGGIAGHAGVFSTAEDVALYAQALLDRLAGRASNFPLKQATLKLMCEPEQPAAGRSLRGYGWDIDSPYSRPRGEIFPVGSFGHTGFTGTSLWMDPRSDTYVILLANAVHPRGRAPISALRGKVATAAARALGLYTSSAVTGPKVLTGIDTLEAQHFAPMTVLAKQHGGQLRIGLLTNQTGVDSNGKRTIDVLMHDAPKSIQLRTLFSPEHGISGAEDKEGIGNATDAATKLPVLSLYGVKPEDRRPKIDDLKKLDAVVIDLQDAGVRFYTYETVVGYFVEAAAKAGIDLIVLDRPALTSGVQVAGPVSDPNTNSYTSYMQEPIQHGMTLGELAQFINGEGHLGASITVVPMQNWQRGLWFDQTGLPWTNTSPNLRSVAAAAAYPGIELLQFTNVSVGRGTEMPFGHIGAAWIATDAEAQKLADTLNARKLTAVSFEPTTFKPEKPYPFADQFIHGVQITVLDRQRLDAPALGIELITALHQLYPTQFLFARSNRLVLNQATIDAITAGKDPHEIAAAWEPALAHFREQRARYLLYGYLPSVQEGLPLRTANRSR